MAHIETGQIQVEMHRTLGVPASISVVAFGISLSAFLALSYALCILFYVLFPGSAEQHIVLSLFLPWLKVLTWLGFLLGLAASVVCGWYITLIFCPLYNYFTARGL
jgi:pilus assembly protein TadC